MLKNRETAALYDQQPDGKRLQIFERVIWEEEIGEQRKIDQNKVRRRWIEQGREAIPVCARARVCV